MRALVTGCAGFIGSHLTESLLADGHEVLGVDCFNDNYGRGNKLHNLRHSQAWDSFEFVPIDLARGDLLDLVGQTDVVYHLAAEPGVRGSWGRRFDTYLRNNVLATQHLLEAARQAPERRRFVYASSSSVYGEAEMLPTPESTTPQPHSPYGTTKLAAEHMCSLYHANHGVQTVSLRYFTVYGPRQRPDMAFNIFCRAAIAGSPITVFGDGHQTRDFTYVADIVAATRAAGERSDVTGHVFNVGGGERVSLSGALEIIEGFADRPLTLHRLDAQYGDVRDTGADTTLAKELLFFNPTTTVYEGLAAEFEWIAERIASGSDDAAGLPPHE